MDRIYTAFLAALYAFLHTGQTSTSLRGQADTVWTPSDNTVLINVLANDGDLGTIRSAKVTQGAHGTVQWLSGRAEYTPAAGYIGTDSFRYAVTGTKGRSGIQQVTITVGNDNAVVLQGSVVDAPIANATLTADVGIARFMTTADAGGNYTLPIAGSGSTMVQLDAFGKDGQSQVQLRSTVGGIGQIRAQAGDGVLTRDENNQVQITQISTAQAYLLYFANGSKDISNQDELDLVAGSIDVYSLSQMAGAIKLVADGEYLMPAGIADTYALISDPAAFSQFMSDVTADDPNAINNAIQATFADANVAVPTQESDFVGTTNLIGEFGAPGTIRVGPLQGERLQLAADGTGTDYTILANPDPDVNWSFNGNVVHVVPVHPVEQTVYVTIDGIQYERIETRTSFDLVKLYEGGTHDIEAYSENVHFHYPSNAFPDGNYSTSGGIYHALKDGSGTLPYLASELTTPRTFAAVGPPDFGPFLGASIFTFNGDGTGNSSDVNHSSRNFTWTIDPAGSLLITYPDNGDSTSYTRIGTDYGYGEAVMAVFDTANGFASSYGASYVSDHGSGFSDVNLAQSWLSGFDISSPSITNFSDFYVRLGGPRSTGTLYIVDANGNELSNSPLMWVLTPDSTMKATNYWSAANGYVPFCQPIQIGVCEAYAARTWRRIAVDGNRIYVLEELYSDYDPYDGRITSNEMFSQRLNFYEVATL